MKPVKSFKETFRLSGRPLQAGCGGRRGPGPEGVQSSDWEENAKNLRNLNHIQQESLSPERTLPNTTMSALCSAVTREGIRKHSFFTMTSIIQRKHVFSSPFKHSLFFPYTFLIKTQHWSISIVLKCALFKQACTDNIF